MSTPEDGGKTVAQLEEELAEIRAVQAKTATTIRALAETVSRLAESRPAAAPTADGTSSTDPDELKEWTTWLIDHYELVDVPPCWPRHGALVGEFDALRVAWQDTIGIAAPGLAAVNWHDALARTMTRVHQSGAPWRRCLDNGHREVGLPLNVDGEAQDVAVRHAG